MTVRSGIPVLVVLTALAAQPAGPAPPVVPWSRAGEHVGANVVVEGWVVGVRCSQHACRLAFEPTARHFTAVVHAADFEALPPADLEHRYSGHQVRVHGRVAQEHGRPEIVVRRPGQLELVPEEAPTAGAEKAPARTPSERQEELLGRLATVLDRIEAVTDRLVDTQERLAALLADVEQRQLELQAMLAPAAPEAERPVASVPRRWRYEALRSIKRGMPAAEVERLLGQPSGVEQGDGWSVWHYGSSGSVSFNARGRVEAFTGFPR
jgi:hypothetical protein